MIVQQLTEIGGAVNRSAPAPQAQREVGAAVAAASPPPSAQQVQQAIEQIQHVLSFVAQNLQFSVDQGTGRTVIRVVDSQTKEVIRQIPTEEAMAIAQALDRMQGLLLDEKA